MSTPLPNTLIISNNSDFVDITTKILENIGGVVETVSIEEGTRQQTRKKTSITRIIIESSDRNFETNTLPQQYKISNTQAKIMVFLLLPAFYGAKKRSKDINGVEFVTIRFSDSLELRPMIRSSIQEFYTGMLPKNFGEIVPKNTNNPTQIRERIRHVKPKKFRKLLVIASSTGGVQALKLFLEKLSPTIQAPIVIVHHIPPNFDDSLVQILQQVSTRTIVTAQDQLLENNCVYIAPFDYHVLVYEDEIHSYIRLDTGEKEHFLRPAADPLFRSASLLSFTDVIGIVFTGMGKDGLLGSQALKDAGGHILCQDKESSVVWGMPAQVFQAGIVTSVHSPDDMSTGIASLWQA